MNTVAIVGSQWGDEGKGKITDLLGQKAELVVRFQGGNNAGHTIIVGNKKNCSPLNPFRDSSPFLFIFNWSRRCLGTEACLKS